MSDTYPIVYERDGIIYYRASALGGCLRALLAARHGFIPKDPPEHMQTIFDRGHEIEVLVKDILLSHGWSIDAYQEEVILDVGVTAKTGKPCKVIGHIDMMTALSVTMPFMLTEVKGFGTDYLDRYRNNGIESMPAYAYQISVYAYAKGLSEYRYIVYKKDTTTHPENSFNRLLITSSDELPTPLSVIKHRIEFIERKMDTAITAMDCTNAYPCPYYYLHDEKERPEFTNTVFMLCESYKSLSARIDEFESAKKAIGQSIIGRLPYNDKQRTFVSQTGNVTVTVASNPKRLDQKFAKETLAAAGVSEAEYMLPGVGVYPRISKKGDKKDGN